MKGVLLLAFFAVSANATDIPFYLRGIDTQRDISAINENFRSIVGDLTKLRADVDAIPTTAATTTTSSTTVASTTTYPSGSLTQATMGPCVGVGTATWTQSANPALVCFAGGMSSSGLERAAVAILLDGAYMPGFSSTLGILGDPTASGEMVFSFCVRVATVSAGSHSACLTMASVGGAGATLTVPANGSTPKSIAQISIFEMPSSFSGATGATGPAGTAGSTVAVTAALTGDGSSTNVLGVNSSSVAVLSGGYVLNSQLDSSSVTKQGFVTQANLTGANPANSVDLSTVTTAFNSVGASTLAITNILTTVGTSTTALSASTVSIVALKVAKAGDTMTGTLNGTDLVETFGVVAATGVFKSTLTVQGNAFSVGASSFVVAGGSGTVAYSMTAGSFSGIGSALTAITAANISAGSLGSSVIASSISYRLSARTCGDATTSCGLTIGVDGTITGTSSNTISGGSSGHTISTGSLTAGSTGYPARTMLTFDSQFFMATDTAAQNATFISLATNTAVTAVVFGSATYDTNQVGAYTNGVWTTLTGSTIALTGLTVGLPIFCQASVSPAVNEFASTRYLMDGRSMGVGAQPTNALTSSMNGNTSNQHIIVSTAATATSHSFTLQGQGVTGTGDNNCGTTRCFYYCSQQRQNITVGVGGGLSSISLGTATINADGVTITSRGGIISTGSWIGDSTFFTVSTNGFVSLSTTASAVPTRQIFLTTGSGIYYSTASTGATPRQLVAEFCGGGGAGGSAYTTGADGNSASATVFGSTSAAGGRGGAGSGGGTGNGGGPITSGGSSALVQRFSGNGGGAGSYQSSSFGGGGNGGGSAFFGGGANSKFTGVASDGQAGAPNTGGGGSGATPLNATAGGGGSGGECVRAIINNPPASITFSVSTGAAAGTSNDKFGGVGGSGIIIVTEIYSTIGSGEQNTYVSSKTFTSSVQASSNVVVGMTYTTTNACALATTCSVSCPSNTWLTSGGCLNGTLTFGVSGSYPSSSTTWVCDSTGAVGITAYAICSRLSP